MNLRKTCPDIPDDWKGGITDVARILGGDRPLSRQTVMRYIRLGHKNGGMKATLNAGGFYRISGKEVKRFWSKQ